MTIDLSQFALTDKVALVTGGGQGIGLAIAIGMAKAGADVVVASRNAEKITEAAKEIRSLGRRSLAIPCDVADREQVRRTVDQAYKEFGRIDILVNNSGISPSIQPVENVTDEEWDYTLRVNMQGTADFCRFVGEIMLKQKSGSIVNIASVGGPVALPLLTPYCQSKAAVVGLSKALAAEWAQHNIRVNVIAPAWIKSPMNERLRFNPDYDDFIQKEIIDKTPLRRWGEDYEVANAAIFLASQAAGYITGDVLFVDGGLSII